MSIQKGNINMQSYIYNIAEWKVTVCFLEPNQEANIEMLPSFQNFRVAESDCEPLFTMTVDQSLELVSEDDCTYTNTEQTNNGDIKVSKTQDKGYQFTIYDLHGDICAMMQSNDSFSDCKCRVYGKASQRSFGMNNAMMLAYAFAGARHKTILVHASVIRHYDKGYAFVARSGTGKSTQTQNWLKTIENCDLLNDDNPAVRVINGEAWIYGTPWSGKTPCYKQEKALLAAVTKIDRKTTNYVEEVPKLVGFNHLLSSCSVLRCDKETYLGICDTVSAVCTVAGNYILHCTAAPESALVCYKGISNK